jgi:hypothetical protein
MSIETFALGLVAIASAGMAIFVWSAFVVSHEADEADERALGDWPYRPEVFPPRHDEGCSQ